MRKDDRSAPGDGRVEGTNELLAAVLRDMTAVSDVRTTLPPQFVVAVRFAALVALDAGRDAYLSLLRAAEEQGLVLDDAQQVLVVLAPLLGRERTSFSIGEGR